MFLSLGLIFFLGVIGGIGFEKIKIPKIIWYLILGVLLGPSVFNIISEDLLNISAILRQIALVLILTRSGLSLDLNSLKKVGVSAILMCFVPACFEIIGIVIFAPILLHISYLEAFLLGSVLAAVSPAIVVPRMIQLKEKGYGKTIPELIMAGASCDDIFVIVLFYSFKSLLSSQKLNPIQILQIPSSILFGILVGCIIGIIISKIYNKINNFTSYKIIILIGISFLFIFLENILKPYLAFSSLLAIIIMAIWIKIRNKDQAKKIQAGYNQLWQGFEILLFVLVGCATDITYALSKDGAILLGLLFIGLIFRSIGVALCIVGTSFNLKEKIYIIISYLPKATVQASIGGIALSEGLSCGALVLTAAVISIIVTAPIGAIAMDLTYKKLSPYDPLSDTNNI